MSDVILNRIKSKVKTLVDKNHELHSSNQQLESEITHLKSVIEQQKEEYAGFNDKIKMLKMAKSLDGSSDGNKEMKLKINELVREIDKCISLLNK